MRLGQLARKLSIRPAQIVEFLAQHSINIEDNSNLRMEESHVERVVGHYAPESIKQIMSEPEEAEEVAGLEATPEPEATEVEPIQETVELSSTVEPEIIRVQKIELSGLKVVGKIELPEPKKKEPVVENEEGNPPTEVPPETKQFGNKRKPKRETKDRAQQRTWKNPLEFQREREAREAEEKKRMQRELEKERRKKHYEEKRKGKTQPKRIKPEKQSTQIQKPVDTRPVPKTWFGKFLRWWTT